MELVNFSWQIRVILVPVLLVNLFERTVQISFLLLNLYPFKVTQLPLINLMGVTSWNERSMLSYMSKGSTNLALSLSTIVIKPKVEDEGYDKWEAENSMIMSWLVNSMEPSLGRTYLFLPTASAIWSAVKETYSDIFLALTLSFIPFKTQQEETNGSIFLCSLS